MTKTLLVFDIDDTLTQSAAIHIECFIESLNELGVEKMDTNFGGYLHHTDSYVAKTIYEKELWQTFTEDLKSKFEKLLSDKMAEREIEEVPGAALFVKEAMKSNFVAVCFATGSLRRPAVQKLKAIGVSFNNELLVASDQLQKRESIVKSSISKAKKHYGVADFDRIISIGDGLWDLKTANNLGLEFVGVGLKNRALMEENGCKKWYENYLNLKINHFL